MTTATVPSPDVPLKPRGGGPASRYRRSRLRVRPPQSGWGGRSSNLRMAESKSAALPLGYAPTPPRFDLTGKAWRRQLDAASPARQGASRDPHSYADVSHEPPMSATNPSVSSLPIPRDPQLRRMADAIRVLAMDAVERGAERPSRHADGHGGRRDRAVEQVPQIRSGPSRLARPRPLRAVGRATARCCFTRCCILPAIPT